MMKYETAQVKIYEQHIRPLVEPKDKGKVRIAIDVDSGDYSIDEPMIY